jgi:hypothetical protein
MYCNPECRYAKCRFAECRGAILPLSISMILQIQVDNLVGDLVSFS